MPKDIILNRTLKDEGDAQSMKENADEERCYWLKGVPDILSGYEVELKDVL